MRPIFFIAGLVIGFIGYIVHYAQITGFILGISIDAVLFTIAAFFLVIAFILGGKGEDLEEFSDHPKHKIITVWRLILLFIVLICVWYYIAPHQVERILQMHPPTFEVFSIIKLHITTPTYLGLFSIFLVGSLFFIFIPLEPLFLYFSSSLNPVLAILIGTIGQVLGLVINYGFGRLFSKRIEHNEKWQRTIYLMHKFGSPTLIVSAFTPLPFQLLTFAAGGLRFPFKRFVVVITITLIIKYIFIFIYGNALLEWAGF
ncbi:MAG: YqaA family protein [Candidatus Woesearchaeota archaeon]